MLKDLRRMIDREVIDNLTIGQILNRMLVSNPNPTTTRVLAKLAKVSWR